MRREHAPLVRHPLTIEQVELAAAHLIAGHHVPLGQEYVDPIAEVALRELHECWRGTRRRSKHTDCIIDLFLEAIQP